MIGDLLSALSCCMPPDKRALEQSLSDQSSDGYMSSEETLPFAQKPRMILDEEQHVCFGCEIRFDVLVRRHHCRRCRNIYCQNCSRYTDRLLMYGELKPVRLCFTCARAAPAENWFVERQIPLLREGATLIRQALLARRVVHLRVTADLSTLEETEAVRGRERTHHHPLDEVESVAAAGAGGGHLDGETSGGGYGVTANGDLESVRPPVFVIRLRGKGQLKLEACTFAERDLWVSALEEAVRRRRSPPLADEVEEERWARRQKEEVESQRRKSLERRRQHESSRARMATKYGLDPAKYASRSSNPSRIDGEASGDGTSVAPVAGVDFGPIVSGVGGKRVLGRALPLLSTAAR